MICSIRGIEYFFILDQNYDYFDIIPELELLTRKRLSLSKNMLRVITTIETDKRLLDSKYYKDKKDIWFNYGGLHQYKINDSHIPFTENETILINNIYLKLKDKIIDQGWYDVAFYQ